MQITIVIVAINILGIVISILFYKNVFKNTTRENRNAVIGLFGMTSFFIALSFFGLSSLYNSEVKSWFFPGHIVIEEVFVEGDGETVDHYEDEHRFLPDRKIDINSGGGVDFFILFVFFGSVAISYFLFVHTTKREDSKSDEAKTSILYIIVSMLMATGLTICLLPMPHQYYYFIRWLIFVGTLCLMDDAFKKVAFVPYLFFLLVLILFNPLYLVHFSRLVWNIIDIIVVIILLAGSVKRYIDLKYENY